MTAPRHRPRVRRRRWPTDGQSGQVVVLFALSLFAIFAIVGLAVDGGFGLNQLREAQNAADFASQSGTSQLVNDCNQGNAVPQSTVYHYIAGVVSANIGGNPPWTAEYLDKLGQPLVPAVPVSITPPAKPDAPAGACGIATTVTPNWGPFIEQILGVAQLSTSATARAILQAPAGIDSLARSGLHTIYAGGNGLFVVDGSINDNSAGCDPFNPGTNEFSPYGPCNGTDGYGDTVDAFGNGQVAIFGTVNAVDPHPLDPCFSQPSNAAAVPVPTYAPSATLPNPSVSSLPNHATPLSSVTFGGTTYPCDSRTINPNGISYNAITTGASAITNDPLGFLPTPSANSTICAGGSLNTVSGFHNYSGGEVLDPGVYTGPVEVSGSATFHSCPNNQPGVYVFDQGLEICPQASGDVVSSGNAPTDTPGSTYDGGVTLYSAGVYGGSPGSACPTLGTGQDGDGDGDSSDFAVPSLAAGIAFGANVSSIPITPGLTQALAPGDVISLTDSAGDYQALTVSGRGAGIGASRIPVATQTANAAFPSGSSVVVDMDSPVMQMTWNLNNAATSPLWPVMDYGITIGGVVGSTVTLAAPGAGQGQWGQVALFANRLAPADIGLNAGYQDGALITITGDLYDASMVSPIVAVSTEACAFAPVADGGEVIIGNGGSGIPGAPPGPCESQSSAPQSPDCSSNCVTLQGVAVVDAFDTLGNGNLLIKPPPPPPGAGDVELVQ